MKRPQWIVRLSGYANRYALPKVEVEGPSVTALLGDVIEKLADLADYEGLLTECWFDFVNARRALVKGDEDLVDDVTRESLIEALDDARAAVLAELPASLTLDMASARMLAGELDEAVGRVGSVAA